MQCLRPDKDLRDSHSIHTWSDGAAIPNKASPDQKICYLLGVLAFKVFRCGKQTIRHLGGKTLDTVSVMLCLLSNSVAGGVREDRWLQGEG